MKEYPCTSLVIYEIYVRKADNEVDDAVRAFKQKIRRLEKAAKLGNFDLAEKNEGGGIWLNNLESLGGGNMTQENIDRYILITFCTAGPYGY
jgi:hypothetical protein